MQLRCTTPWIRNLFNPPQLVLILAYPRKSALQYNKRAEFSRTVQAIEDGRVIWQLKKRDKNRQFRLIQPDALRIAFEAHSKSSDFTKNSHKKTPEKIDLEQTSSDKIKKRLLFCRNNSN